VAQVDRPAHLTCYLGGLDRFTAAGAADYLLGLGADPGAGAAWGRGRLRRSSVPSRHEVELPLFPGRVSVHPYVGAETARLADALGLAGAEGYAVFPGDAVRVVLGRFAGQQSHDPGALDETVAALCHAAEVDLAGRSPFHMMSAQVDGGPAGAPATRTAVLHGADAASVTGAVAILAADAVLDGRVPPGVVHRAAEVLAPDLVVEAMRAHPSVLTLDVVDGPVGVADPAEEGEL